MVNNVAFITNNVFITNDLKALTTAANIARASTEALAASTVRLKRTLDLVSRGIANLKGGINTLPTDLTIGVDASAVGAAQKELEELKKKAEELNTLKITIPIDKVKQEKNEDEDKKSGKTLKDLVSSAVSDMPDLISDIIKKGIENIQLKKELNYTTNGHAAESIAGIEKINNKYGLSGETGMQGFRSIAASTRGTLDATNQASLYEGTGAMVAALGQNDGTAAESYSDIAEMAKGATISVEALENLAGHLPGTMGMAADAIGKSQEELYKMAENGELLTKDFLPKFANEMKNDFGPAALQMANDPQAQMNRLATTISNLKETFQNDLMPIFTPFINLFSGLASWIGKNQELISVFAGALFIAGAAFFLITSGIELWTLAQSILNATMFENPIVWIIAGIVGLIAGIAIAWNKFEGFRGAIMGVWEVLKNIGTIIKDMIINNIMGMIKGIEGLGTTISLLFEGKWKEAATTGKEAFKNLSGINAAAKSASDVSAKFNKGYESGKAMKKIEIPQLKSFLEVPLSKNEEKENKNNKNIATSNNLNTKSNEVTGGGLRSIVFNIDTLGVKGGMTVNAQTINEGISNIHDIIVSELNRALDSVGGVVAN